MRYLAASLLSLVLAPLPACAAPDRTNVRYDEDWSSAAGAEGIDRLKYVRLDASGDIYATLGLELRTRYEGFDNPLWGASRDDGYLWLRAMPSLDVEAGPLRAFVQPIAGYARGVNGGNGPADQTGIDLLQGFGEWRVPLATHGTITLRAGRELFGLGSERLVGLRYGPNIPQPFDGMRAIIAHGAVRLDLMRLRPVQIGLGNFDDRTSQTRKLEGAYATWTVAPNIGVDLYLLGYRNDLARFDGISGVERRRTYGVRAFGKRGGLSWNWELMIQRGWFAGQPIRAWSLATETGISFPAVRLQPRLRLRANVASGDSKTGDGKLETFNAMFPKGKYFGELSPIGPRNIINIHPGIDLVVAHGVGIELTEVSYWRASTSDGVYDVPGQEIRAAGASKARHIGDQIELSTSWKASATVSFAASLSLFRAGRFLKETGAARPIHMVGTEAMLKF